MLYKNITVKNDVLNIGGISAITLAEQYGTPLYVLDENVIRENAATYISALAKYAPAGSMPFFASKACSFKELYRIVKTTGMGTDLVSPGEIYTARAVGFDMTKTIFHGNNKTDSDIRYAMESGVGFFATDTFEELEAVDRIAGEMGVRQKILLRVTPGIDAHTHKAITTGNVDSKFGFPMFSGDAVRAAEIARKKKNLILCGVHCHIGSQITELQPYLDTVGVAMRFIKENIPDCRYFNIGGGFGIPYKPGDLNMDIDSGVKAICSRMRELCDELGMEMPALMMEPGRSVVGPAGTTLYTVGSVKVIPGVKNYISVDGGMTDNPRFALYHADYTCLLVNRMDEDADFVCSIAGRCCESGDLMQENVHIPKPVKGDILAVLGTGAYNFSMSSNYNRLCRPATVIICDGVTRVAIRRESFEHLTALEI